ncbi:MAG: glycosyltransferase family 1 protein [Patescibacteria group bacterium]
MRIGIDARMYGAESTTGIGAYIKNLTDQLFTIDQKNEYVLFMRNQAFSEFKIPNSRIKKVKIDCPWYSLKEQIQLPSILSKHKLDLVHFPHFNAAIFYPGKIILTVHDITPRFFPGPKVKKSLIRKLGYEFVFKTSLKKAKKIITISEHTKNNLLKFFPTAQNKIAITYLGVTENFKVITNQTGLKNLKAKYGITKPFLFYVGVWRDHKNLPGLIKAFEILKSQYNLDYQLVLGGKPDSRYPEIKEAIDSSKVKTDIILPGFITEAELPLFYNSAHLFVLPSFCEGFGLVALESLACGTPIVASNTTSLPEILQDAAVYFDPNSPDDIAKIINQVLTNNELYQNLQTSGFKQIKRYSWQNCAKQTLEIYQSL